MTDFPPNPLVTALAQRLLSQRAQDDGAAQLRSDPDAEAQQLANEFAADPTIPPLVTFAGFLGGAIDAAGTTWRVLYLDAKLLTWLLVSEDDIVQSERVTDITAPFGQRDVIWLKSSASLTEGTGPPRAAELEAQFLRGDFIGADDFSASLTGGTFSRATGLLCEVQTPGCCGRRTR